MPKIQFDKNSYIEITKSTHPEKIIITIAAKDNEKPLCVIANSVEITKTQLEELLKL